MDQLMVLVVVASLVARSVKLVATVEKRIHSRQRVYIVMIELRVLHFYRLHNNPWFHRMNLSLEIIKTEDKVQKYMLAHYGSGFFY